MCKFAGEIISIERGKMKDSTEYPIVMAKVRICYYMEINF